MPGNTAYRSSAILTEEQYLAFERTSKTRHEFLAGHVYDMAGASREHNLITGNIAGALRF